MEGSSFLNAFMPIVPLLFLFTGLLVAWAFLVRAWVRRFNAQRRKADAEREQVAPWPTCTESFVPVRSTTTTRRFPSVCRLSTR